MRFAAKILLVVAVLGAGSTVSRPAAAGGLPVETPACGAIIDHSFKLGGPKTCNGTAFNVVGKTGITIDLGGHILLGNGTGTGVIVQEPGVTVRNGTIRRFGTGVDVTGAAGGAVVEGIVAVDNVQTGIGTNGKGSTLRRNIVVANDLQGISAAAKNLTVSRNTVVNNPLGIRVYLTGSRIASNHVASSDGIGIVVEGSEHEIVSNRILGNGNRGAAQPGMLMEAASSRNVVTRNVIVGNGDDGYRDMGTKNVASRNVAHGNGYFSGDSDGFGTGMDASGATSPKGGKNRSLGNDATTQCVGVGCTQGSGVKDLPVLTPACGALITDSFRLGGNKTCTGHGFVIGAPDVTIDLAGHTVRGDGDAGDYGIVNDFAVPGSGKARSTVKNGVVRSFGHGIRLFSGSEHVVSGIVSVDSSHCIAVSPGPARVTKTTAAACSNGLILGGGTGIVARSVNVVNNGVGVAVSDVNEDSTLVGSTIAGNEQFGLTTSGDRLLAEENRILGNGIATNHVGVLVTNSFGATFRSNLIVGNGGTGYLDDSGGPEITANVSQANGYVNGVSDATGKGFDTTGAVFPEGSGNVVGGNDSVMDECDHSFHCD